MATPEGERRRCCCSLLLSHLHTTALTPPRAHAPVAAAPPPGRSYVCPVYLHTHSWDARLGSNTDVDDCLFELLLPPGRFSPAHWVTRNVVLLVTSDPTQLAGMQAK